MIKDYNVKFTEKEISSIYQKIKDYPWDSVKDLDGWEPVSYTHLTLPTI